MARKIFIDGTVVATTGNLYTRDITCGCEHIPEGCEVIVPTDGIWYVTEPSGSMFDSYYVRGGVTAFGIDVGNIYAFKSIYEFTVRDFHEDLKNLKSMLNTDIPAERKSLFYQQQLVSAFSLLEWFLNCTLYRETCDREDAYQRVWDSGCLDRLIRGSDNRAIKKGPDCIRKELLYMETVNQFIYHNAANVRKIFDVAFGIDVNLEPLAEELGKRHTIVHHFGYDKHGCQIRVSRDEVLSLLNNIDGVANVVADQIMRLPSMPD